MSAAEWLFTDEFDLARRKKYQPAPELALAAAVLGEARIDLLRGPGHLPQTKALYDATRAWIESDRTDWPYAFVPLCEVLGLEVMCSVAVALSTVQLRDAAGGAGNPVSGPVATDATGKQLETVGGAFTGATTLIPLAGTLVLRMSDGDAAGRVVVTCRAR